MQRSFNGTLLFPAHFQNASGMRLEAIIEKGVFQIEAQNSHAGGMGAARETEELDEPKKKYQNKNPSCAYDVCS